MAEKIDTSPEEEAVKDDARQFMAGLVGSGNPTSAEAATTRTADGAEIVRTWKSRYAAASNDSRDTTMEAFWSLYDPNTTSIWTMVYDEADSNENLEETIGFVSTLLYDQPGMGGVRDDCFAVVHTLDSLEMEGLWFLNGPDPEPLFAANEETSWYTFSQLGPEATDLVRDAVGRILMPVDGRLGGRAIRDTKVF